MAFRCGSGELAPGFGRRPTLGETARRAGDTFAVAATMLLIVLITLLPWLAAPAPIWLICRVAWRRLPVPPAAPEAAQASCRQATNY